MKNDVTADRPFKQVDVFTDRAGYGNPVAVILEAEGLSDEEMQRLANWTNLSETVFVFKDDRSDYRARIFTPSSELDFAGHPTIGTAHAALEAGWVADPKAFSMQCRLGRIDLHQTEGLIWARVPAPKQKGSVLDEGELRASLGGQQPMDPLLFDIGPVWLVGRLQTVQTLREIRPDWGRLSGLTRKLGDSTGLVLYAFTDEGGIEVRAFAPAEGVNEDPVCGSGNLCAARHLEVTGGLERIGRTFVSRQGMNLGRNGRLHLKVLEQDIELGGHAVTVFDGTARI
jgi:PhzF family phenazine biosynthesis protein